MTGIIAGNFAVSSIPSIVKVNPEIRFLGEDYINKTNYTGHGLAPKKIFLNRNHGQSTTKFKKLISNSIK